MAKPNTPKRTKKVVEAEGIAHVKATFNNTVITITDNAGNTIVWASAGKAGFKGSKKSTPFAATVAGEQVGREAAQLGVKRVDVAEMYDTDAYRANIRHLTGKPMFLY